MKQNKRYEEVLISEMREAGLLVTEAIEERIYVEVFSAKAGERFDPITLFAACKIKVGGNVEAETKPLPGEIQ